MRILIAFFLASILCACTIGDDGCGPNGPVVKNQINDTLIVAIPQGVDSIVIYAFEGTVPFEIIRIPTGDSIRIEATIATATLRSEPLVSNLTAELQLDLKRLFIRAGSRPADMGEKLRSQIDCTPMPDRMDITHAKIYLPEGVDIPVVSF